MRYKQKKYIILDFIWSIIYSIILYLITIYIVNNKVIDIISFLLLNDMKIYVIIPVLTVFALMLIVRGFTRDSFKANLLVTIIYILISIFTYYKMKILEEPIVAGDIYLIKNLNQVATFALSWPSYNLIISICLLSVIMIIQKLIIIKIQIFEKSIYKKVVVNRIIMFLLGSVIIYIISFMPNRYTRLGIKNTPADNCKMMGAPPVFFMSIGDIYVKPPKDYSKEYIDNIKNEIETEYNNIDYQNIENPNIILIMNESFSNPNRIENVKYSANPIKNIEQLAQNDKNCIMGNNMTPVLGGGTSIPEFEVLTGLTSYFLEKQIYPHILVTLEII